MNSKYRNMKLFIDRRFCEIPVGYLWLTAPWSVIAECNVMEYHNI